MMKLIETPRRMKRRPNDLCALVLAAAMGLAASANAGQGGETNSTSGADTNKPALTIEDFVTDKVIAKGKGFELKRSRLDQAVVNAMQFYAQQGQPVTAGQRPSLEARELNYLLTVRVLNLKATPENKARGKEDADKAYDARRKSAPSEELFVSNLKSMGMDPESYRAAILDEAVGHYVMLDRVKVTEEQIKKYYDDNPEAAEVREQARINFIKLGGVDMRTGKPPTEEQRKAKKKELEDIRERVVKGEDFAKLAKDYSEDPEAKQSGGEVSLPRGARGAPPEFEVAAFALQTNEVSQVISTDFGYFLIKLKEKVPARKYALAEASPLIRKFLENQEIEKALPATVEALKKEFAVEILDERLKAYDEVFIKPAPSPGATETNK